MKILKENKPGVYWLFNRIEETEEACLCPLQIPLRQDKGVPVREGCSSQCALFDASKQSETGTVTVSLCHNKYEGVEIKKLEAPKTPANQFLKAPADAKDNVRNIAPQQ